MRRTALRKCLVGVFVALWMAFALAPPAVAVARCGEGSDAGPGEAGGVARIEFAETSYDFGIIKMGPVATHVFTFRNRGSVKLSLLPPRAS